MAVHQILFCSKHWTITNTIFFNINLKNKDASEIKANLRNWILGNDDL